MLLEGTLLAVDSFSHKQAGVLYFCSHAHGDHLKGLHKNWRRGSIYCSTTTAHLLCHRWPLLKDHVCPLHLGVVHRLGSGDEANQHSQAIDVMLLDANHVPGSTMFVFSGSFGTILYTGDFRLAAEHAHLSTLPMLQKGLDRIFVDNTFCHPQFEHPPRDVSTRSAIESAASKWPCILFVSVYQLGKEKLLLALAKNFRTRVLVPEARAEALRVIGFPEHELFEVEPSAPEFASAEDLHRLAARGYVWGVARKQLRAALLRSREHGIAAHALIPSGWAALRIQKSHTSVNNDYDSDDGNLEGNEGIQLINYSDHCSFLELVQFLSFLPVAPLTFLSRVPAGEDRGYGYNGEEGLRHLLDQTGVPSAVYQVSPFAGQGELTQRGQEPRVMRAKGGCRPMRCGPTGIANSVGDSPRCEEDARRAKRTGDVAEKVMRSARDGHAPAILANVVRQHLEISQSGRAVSSAAPCPGLRMARRVAQCDEGSLMQQPSNQVPSQPSRTRWRSRSRIDLRSGEIMARMEADV